MKSSNHIIVQGWMINELSLKGNDLLLFAVIYGFSQDGNSKFTGSLKYLSGAISAHKNTVLNSLNNLVELELIIKESYSINNINFCKYYHNELVVQKMLGGGTNLGIVGGTNFGINNTILDNTNIEEFIFSFFNNLSSTKKTEFLSKLNPKAKKSDETKILFSSSSWNDLQFLREKLLTDKEFIKEFKGVDLKNYIEDVLAWSISSNTKRTNQGWYMTLRQWMKRDLKANKLSKLPTKEPKQTGYQNF